MLPLYFLALQCLCLSLHAHAQTPSPTPVTIAPSGLVTVSPDDTGVKEAAEFALQQINLRRFNVSGILRLIQIISAEYEDLKGAVYVLQLEVTVSRIGDITLQTEIETTTPGHDPFHRVCTVQVWQKPLIDKRYLIFQNCSTWPQRRRRATNPGGLADADVNEEGVKSAADLGLAEIDKRSNSAYKQALVQILSVKKQVVAGTLYHLQLEVGETSCEKGSSKADSECSLREGSNTQVCNVKVLDRPWLNKQEVAQLHCSAKS